MHWGCFKVIFTGLENQQSVVAKHSAKTKYGTEFKKTEALINICTYHPHIITEAIKIVKQPHNFNCEDGHKLSSAHGSSRSFLLNHCVSFHWIAPWETQAMAPSHWILPCYTFSSLHQLQHLYIGLYLPSPSFTLKKMTPTYAKFWNNFNTCYG